MKTPRVLEVTEYSEMLEAYWPPLHTQHKFESFTVYHNLPILTFSQAGNELATAVCTLYT